MSSSQRTIGLLGATLVGIGAIVGGGILVLAGVAFQETGPSAVLAFAFNGFIAVLTALSFAEMSSSFPENGGAYTFAKRVLSVRSAFAVGWVIWFAYIVAAVLYALGFAAYAVEMFVGVCRLFGAEAPAFLLAPSFTMLLAVLASAFYGWSLLRKTTGGGQSASIAKVAIFALLILVGLGVMLFQGNDTPRAALSPFFSAGGVGLLMAMGYTFIAVQGFDLIAAIAGEVKEPERTIPKAMLMSLGVAMAVYLPLLMVVSYLGPAAGQSITAMSTANPDTVMASAVEHYMGPFGYWLVVVAAILSTLTALQANYLAASRIALAMAQDRTLPHFIEEVDKERSTPTMAIYVTGLAIFASLILLRDLSSAGAAASLIFLITFALAHMTNFLARKRVQPKANAFQTPLFPLVPVLGFVACVLLSVFQALAVPLAGSITLIWLGIGVVLYLSLFSKRAEVVDAYAEMVSPDLVQFRGRSPLVLIPVANPKNASTLMEVAAALSPPAVGRALLLSVVKAEENAQESNEAHLDAAQSSLHNALEVALERGCKTEALMTLAQDPWPEIVRVAESHRCESLLLGATNVVEDLGGSQVEKLLSRVECDVVVLRSPEAWHLSDAKRILVPTRGRGGHDVLRARLLGSLMRQEQRDVTFLHITSSHTSDAQVAQIGEDLVRLGREETGFEVRAEVVRSDDVNQTLREQSMQNDLLVLGLQRIGRHDTVFGEMALALNKDAPYATIMISKKR
ncbi:MAG: amino acid transporter [Myxococcales bacterium]|nr:amino acid transporter [Myxococcales bacterium]